MAQAGDHENEEQEEVLKRRRLDTMVCDSKHPLSSIFKCGACLLMTTARDPPCYFDHAGKVVCTSRFHRSCLLAVKNVADHNEDDDNIYCPGCRTHCEESSHTQVILPDLVLKQIAEHIRMLQCEMCASNASNSSDPVYMTTVEYEKHTDKECPYHLCTTCATTHTPADLYTCAQRLHAKIAAIPVCSSCGNRHNTPEDRKHAFAC